MTFKRILLILSLFFGVFSAGVIGYLYLEKISFLDACYMTLITISTVGFKEVKPLSTEGKIFTMVLIVAGVGVLFYTLGTAIEFFFEGHLTGFLELRRRRKMINHLVNHYIVCGYGRVGEQVAKELKKNKAPFVVIDIDSEKIEKCKKEGFLYLFGNASKEEMLIQAGVKKAKGLVAAVDTDADNVFVVLTARVLNPNLFIVARANEEETEEKLLKAGANRVVSPAVIGGRRMSNLLIRPLVCDYLDIVTHGHELEFQLEEQIISPNSILCGKSISENKLREKTGVLILAVKKKAGEFNTNPAPTTLLESGDTIVVMGTKGQLESLQNLL